ncbi:MAG TPA: sensor histidine kinase, partial [Methanospirillum sp.]|nr:sensor histidine kinase [Methanospirillum sp.]
VPSDIDFIHTPTHGAVFVDLMFVKVLENLIENAVRHGVRVKTITVSTRMADHALIIQVEDDGIGIPDDEKEKIFERGYGKNTGFGLFLAREILSITGISIQETGQAGKGARFVMTVPEGRWRRVGEM